MFQDLIDEKVPGPIIKLLCWLYRSTKIKVSWNNNVSPGYFTQKAGVKQGGVCSAILFRHYMLPLCEELNQYPGLTFKDTMINNICYADDFILLAINNLHGQILVNICDQFGKRRNIQWNATKTYVIRFRHSNKSSIAKKRTFSPLSFPGSPPFSEVESEKWLGYILCADLKDDKLVKSQAARLYCASNQIIDNIRPKFLSRKSKRAIINAYGCIYLVGTLDNYTKKSWSALRAAHRYLVRKVTGMSHREEMLYEVDPEYCEVHELTGVKQLFENGGLYPDTRSRWPYGKFDILTIDGLQQKSVYRLNKTYLSPH